MSQAVVLDASAILGFLMDAGSAPAVVGVMSDERQVAIPHHCDLEVLSALRTWVRRGALTPQRASEAIELYESMSVSRLGPLPFLRRTFILRNNFSVYDAAYVALAEVLEASFYTADTRLARAVEMHTDVTVVEV